MPTKRQILWEKSAPFRAVVKGWAFTTPDRIKKMIDMAKPLAVSADDLDTIIQMEKTLLSKKDK